MPYTMEDFKKDAKREFVSRLTLEERIEGLTPEQRVEGLTPAQLAATLLAADLTPEQRTQLRRMFCLREDDAKVD